MAYEAIMRSPGRFVGESEIMDRPSGRRDDNNRRRMISNIISGYEKNRIREQTWRNYMELAKCPCVATVYTSTF
jgi:hypothetical protein